MKYPKGPQKQSKVLNLVWIVTAGLMVFAGGLYMDYDKQRLSQPTVMQQVEMANAKVPSNIYLHGELDAGQFYTIKDEEGNIIDYTSRMLWGEDEVILANNKRYIIDKVDYANNQAVCKYVGTEDIRYLDAWDSAPVALMDDENVKIGVYMTHSDESYIPTDGTESIEGNGGILKVGERLSEVLEKRGAEVIHNDNTHDPHDANAYHRSRQTAVQLLKQNPDVIFDVHRDGVEDPGFYARDFEGEPVTSVRIVVGKQNPHMDANLTFAKEIKAYFDKNYPGMIKGIFMGKGDYNQDLGPRVLLLEAGTHTNSREEAEAGIAVFADGVSKYLQVSTGTDTGIGSVAPKEEKTKVDDSSGSVAAILALVAIGGGLIFLFISRGAGAKN